MKVNVTAILKKIKCPCQGIVSAFPYLLVGVEALAGVLLTFWGKVNLESSLQAEELRPGSSPGLYSHG